MNSFKNKKLRLRMTYKEAPEWMNACVERIQKMDIPDFDEIWITKERIDLYNNNIKYYWIFIVSNERMDTKRYNEVMKLVEGEISRVSYDYNHHILEDGFLKLIHHEINVLGCHIDIANGFLDEQRSKCIDYNNDVCSKFPINKILILR